jgi:hypothetical protein
VGSPYDFSRAAEPVQRARLSIEAWLARDGLKRGEIPRKLRPHDH